MCPELSLFNLKIVPILLKRACPDLNFSWLKALSPAALSRQDAGVSSGGIRVKLRKMFEIPDLALYFYDPKSLKGTQLKGYTN